MKQSNAPNLVFCGFEPDWLHFASAFIALEPHFVQTVLLEQTKEGDTVIVVGVGNTLAIE
jgi:hypothetical protein